MNSSLAKNAIYKVILNVFNLLVPLLVGPYIAGLLEPEVYGVYNRVYAEFQVFFIVGAFGIYNYGVREISKVKNDPEKFSAVLTSLFTIGVLSNLLVTVFYVVYFLVRSDGIDLYVYMVMILQMASNVFYIEFVNEAVENYRFITVKTILIRLAYLVGIFLFVRKSTDVIAYSLVVSLTVLANNMVSFFYLKRNIPFRFKNLKILCYIAPLIVNLIFVNVELLYSQLDKVMLGAFVSDIAVTEYNLPTTLVGMVCTIPLSLITVSIPRLSSYLGQGDRESYMQTLQSTSRVYMALLVPMSFGLLVLSREVMWLYSQDVYTYTYPVLMAAALSRIVYGYQSLTTYLVLYVNGQEKKLTVYLLYGGVLNVVLNFILVALGWFTPLTSLLTTTASALLFVVLANRFAGRSLGIRGVLFTKQIRRYIYVAATFIPVCLGINALHLGYLWNIVLEVSLCVGIYGGYLLITRDPLVEVLVNKLPFGKK